MAAGRPPPASALDAGCGAGVIGVCAAAALLAAASGSGGGAEAGASGGASGEGQRRVHVRCQDRDELARLFALRNAAANGIPASVLEAHAEPLLAGPDGARWDLILSNVPAKAGEPVLRDFVGRSAGLLAPGGMAAIVAVRSLEPFFLEQIGLAGAELLAREDGPGHSALAYAAGKGQAPARPVSMAQGPCGSGFLERHPFYARSAASREIEGVSVRIESVHGAPGFDEPGGAALAAARLAARSGLALGAGRLLVHEPAQGFFPCWLLGFLLGARRAAGSAGAAAGALSAPPAGFAPGAAAPLMVLSGRNALALEAARRNAARAGAGFGSAGVDGAVLAGSALGGAEAGGAGFAGAGFAGAGVAGAGLGGAGVDGAALAGAGEGAWGARAVLAADLTLGGEALLAASGGRGYGFAAAFPELLPQGSLAKGADQLGAAWAAAARLLAPGGALIAAFSSSDAERFDRKKPSGFSRLGGARRGGFRALAYRLD